LKNNQSAQTAGRLFAIAYGILQDRGEAEDVVQDSLVKAWKTRWRVRDPEKFPAWLATIARHRAHDILRKTPTFFLSLRRDRRKRTDRHNCCRSRVAFGACQPCRNFIVPRLRCVISKRWNYRSIENMLGVSNGAFARNSRPQSGLLAETASSCSRFNGLKHMATAHNEIDNWLAADLHGELSADERSALHAQPRRVRRVP